MIGDVWPLVSAASMRALDRHTIVTLGVPGELLMESAGRALAEAVLALCAGEEPVLVVCGSGHNGGDGLVAARHLHLLGVPVRVALLAAASALRGDPAANLARAQAVGVPILGLPETPPARGIVVDAIFGTGLAREVAGEARAAIGWIRASRPGCRVIAVDLPSGVDADTGQVLGEAVAADVTVTLGLPKLGLTLEPGRSLAGRIVVARIGIADEAPGVPIAAELWTRSAAGARLPERPRAGHKGSFGHVLVAAGSEGKTGAAVLAAEAAARAGAGLVTLACPASLQPIFEARCTEVMTEGMPETGERALAASALEMLLALAATRDVVALGPGLGTHPDTVTLVRALAARLEKPVVIDADGLNALHDAKQILKGRRASTVLTPHPGEAGRFLGVSAAELNRDRVGAARAIAAETNAVVLLKGAATVTADPAGRAIVNPTGGAALASGGTGDVLTGVVAGFLAQGLAPLEAAALSAYVHGLAADRLERRLGPAGVLAGDVSRELPAASRLLREAARRSRAGDVAARGTTLALAFPEP